MELKEKFPEFYCIKKIPKISGKIFLIDICMKKEKQKEYQSYYYFLNMLNVFKIITKRKSS